jgi:hypothetical protein
MATREEILEEIRKLNDAIVGLEAQLKETSDKDVKLSIDAKITAKQNSLTAKQNTLTALITSQQGKFHLTFPLSFPNLLDVILCPTFIDTSSSPIQVRQRRKVRSNGLCRDVDVRCIDGG